jgi:polar amino acid transport system substrate-binding protein
MFRVRSRSTRTAIVVLAVSSLLLAACGDDSDDTETADPGDTGPADAQANDLLPEEYRESGVVSVGTAVGNPPWGFVEEGSTDPVGFDIDLITALAESLGLEAEIDVAEFPSLIPSLESGRYDVLVSSLTILPDRTEVIDLLAYVQIGTGMLVPAGNPNGITSLSEACGFQVGVAQGSANEVPVEEAQEECGDNPIEIVHTQGNDFVALESGRVDFTVADAAVTLEVAATRPETFEAVEGEIYGAGLAGIAFNKENTGLRDAFQQALQDLIASGEYAEILERWSLTEISYEGAEINPITEE